MGKRRLENGMKLRIGVCVLALILFLAPINVLAGRSRYLDAALTFLEEGNPFLVRYNEMTGAGIQARWPLGCPYFWGGRHVKTQLAVASPSSSSEYYHTDQKYLAGLDCVGFTRWINRKTGYEEHPPISDMLNRSLYPGLVVRGAAKASGEDLSSVLRIGDLVAIQHLSGGFHVGMYCGTPEDFGYTEANVPEALAPYLRYPLLIHCTGSSDYHARYKEWLRAQEEPDVIPPYGGVIVTIVGVPLSAADSVTPDEIGLSVPCFDLDGYHLQITDLTKEKQYRWVRWRQKPET